MKYKDFDIVFANMPISEGLKAVVGEGHTKRPHLILMSKDNHYCCLDMTGSKSEIFSQYHLEKDDYGLNKSSNINLDKIYILHDEHIENYLTHLNDHDINLLIRLLHTVKHKWNEEYRAIFEEKYSLLGTADVGSVIVKKGISYIAYDKNEIKFKCLKINKMIRNDKNVLVTDYITESISVDINKNDKYDVIDSVDEKTIKYILENTKNKLNHKVDIGTLINYRTNIGYKKLMVVGFDDKRIYMIDRDEFFDSKKFYTMLKNSNFQIVGMISRTELKKFLDLYFENYKLLSLDRNVYCQKIENNIETLYKTI